MTIKPRSEAKEKIEAESSAVKKPSNPFKSKSPASASIGIEERINMALGDPKEKAYAMSERLNPTETNDALRHASAGRYAQENISIRAGGGALGKIAGIVGSNVMGIAHEVSSFTKDSRPFASKVRESAEDITNNFVGSMVGANPFASIKSKDNTLLSLVKNNVLPDGYVKDRRDKIASQNVYFKDSKGKTKPSKY